GRDICEPGTAVHPAIIASKPAPSSRLTRCGTNVRIPVMVCPVVSDSVKTILPGSHHRSAGPLPRYGLDFLISVVPRQRNAPTQHRGAVRGGEYGDIRSGHRVQTGRASRGGTTAECTIAIQLGPAQCHRNITAAAEEMGCTECQHSRIPLPCGGDVASVEAV